MSDFIFPSDIDLLYEQEDELIQKMPITSYETKENHMLNTLKFNLANASGSLSVTPDSSNETVTQYQNITIRAVIDNDSLYSIGLYTGFCVILHISTPTDEPLSSINDFDYHIHLRPVIDTPATYEVNLTEFLGNKLTYGELNECQFVFQVLGKFEDNWTSLLQSSTDTINLYKTNTNTSYEPDDLSNAFITLGELANKIDTEVNV